MALRRKILEYSTEIYFCGKRIDTVYIKLIKNRWHYGWLRHAGIKYEDHPFATQREALDWATKEAHEKYNGAKAVIKKIRQEASK